MDRASDSTGVIRRGSQLVSQGEIEAARALWEQHRHQPEVLGHLAWLERTSGHRSRALKLYVELLDRAPDNPEIPFRIGEIWRERGDWIGAAAWFERAKEYPPARSAVRKAKRRAVAQRVFRRMGELFLSNRCGRKIRDGYRRIGLHICSKILALSERWMGKSKETLRLSRYLPFLADLGTRGRWHGLEYHKTRELQLVCRLLSARRTARILDVGTGENPFALYLASEGFNSLCVDGDRRGLRTLARLADPRGRPGCVQGDVRALPFRDGSLDAVTAICVLEHIPGTGDRRAMSEIWRVLRENGTALVTVEAARETRERWEEMPFSVGMEYGDKQEGWIEGFYRDYAPETIRTRLVDPERWRVLEEGFFDERIRRLAVRGWCDTRNHPIAARLLSPWQPVLATLFYRRTDPQIRPLSPSAVAYLALEKKAIVHPGCY